jgi:hypothetical protein
VSPIEQVAAVDKITPAEASALFVESGLSSVDEWLGLGLMGRARVIAAKRSREVQALEDAGQDVAAARLYASVDGGRAWARLMAATVGAKVAQVLRERQGG